MAPQLHGALVPLSPCPSLTWQPGRSARAAYQARWRMAQRCLRSSSSSAQARLEPPFIRTISSARSTAMSQMGHAAPPGTPVPTLGIHPTPWDTHDLPVPHPWAPLQTPA